MKTKEENFNGTKFSGIGMLFINFLYLFAVVALFKWAISTPLLNTPMRVITVVSSFILFILNCIFWAGFVRIEPNESIVMIFFGKYEGTIKENGFYWVNPFYTKKKLTLRARNLDAEPIKVNDKTGNPVMIGAVVVWKIANTYKASFDVDNASMVNNVPGEATESMKQNQKMMAYQNFVKIQSDSALRHVAGMYAYDHNSISDAAQETLRSGGEQINSILEGQLNERLAIAGIEVVEARINYLAYAPEIAAVMLRRQQAEAIISAREKIVDGAVGMVKMALTKLSKEKIIELDDEKKAAMVSNLLVVLCADESAQPVINTGTLYN